MHRLSIIDKLYPAKKPRNFTRDEVIEEMQRHQYRKDFQRARSGMYNWVLRNEKTLLNMYKPKANSMKRGIYVYEFTDGRAYVGLTYSFEIRNHDHKSDPTSPVFIHIKRTGESPDMKVLERDLDTEQAKQREAYWVEWYRSQGWMMLNKAKAGALGTHTKIMYSQQQIDEAVAQCETLKEFKQRFKSIALYCQRNRIKIPLSTPRPCIKLEEANAIASQYGSRGELKRCRPNIYVRCVKHHWLDILYPGQGREHWSDQAILDVARQCDSFADFHMRHTKAYDAARHHGIMQQVKALFK